MEYRITPGLLEAVNAFVESLGFPRAKCGQVHSTLITLSGFATRVTLDVRIRIVGKRILNVKFYEGEDALKTVSDWQSKVPEPLQEALVAEFSTCVETGVRGRAVVEASQTT